MSTKLSYSKISTFATCGQMYKFRYIDYLQEKFSRASLLFGSAMDESLNVLLETRDLEKAEAAFDKKWNFQYIRNEYTALPDNPDIVYAAADFDADLVACTPEEVARFDSIVDAKKTLKWNEVELEDRKFYNLMNWKSLYAKALLILHKYHEQVLPQFQSISAIQEKSEMINSDGDSVVQYLDFIATMQDGSVVLFDNKTTSNFNYYPDDAPSTSQQLVSYYFNNKEKYKLGGVGFVVILKNIIKNKTKTCLSCGTLAEEGSRHKTCAVEKEPGVKKSRCNGEFDVQMNPEAAIKVLVNPVPDATVDLVLGAFDDANTMIKNGVFYRNLSVCKNIYGSPCPYYNACWKGDYSEVVKVEKKT